MECVSYCLSYHRNFSFKMIVSIVTSWLGIARTQASLNILWDFSIALCHCLSLIGWTIWWSFSHNLGKFHSKNAWQFFLFLLWGNSVLFILEDYLFFWCTFSFIPFKKRSALFSLLLYSVDSDPTELSNEESCMVIQS